MTPICPDFDEYLTNWFADVYRLCFLLCRQPGAAMEQTFQAFLRLGAGQPADAQAARTLLFSAAVRQCEDYYLRKPHRKPRRAALEGMGLPFPITDALWRALSLPFGQRAALGLLAADFPPDALKPLGAGHAPKDATALLDAARAITTAEDAEQAMSDRVYVRFAERSVGVENRIHAARSRFDRLAPWLALAALALFAFAAWFSLRMAG